MVKPNMRKPFFFNNFFSLVISRTKHSLMESICFKKHQYENLLSHIYHRKIFSLHGAVILLDERRERKCPKPELSIGEISWLNYFQCSYL